MPADLIIYAIVAAGLVLWLRNMLGTRHGSERQRPNPYMPSVDAKIAQDDDQKGAIEGIVLKSTEDDISDLHDNPTDILSIKTKEAEAGLLEIARADKSFEIKDFVSKAQDAFIYIVGSFADGDRETLKDLTSDAVYSAFDKAMKAREKLGESQITEVLSFDNTEVLEASLTRKTAKVTLRFVAQQTNVVRDKDGNIVSGSENKANGMIDIWTFSRKISSGDPRWFLAETRSDDPDDNDIIPNTD